MKTSPRRSCSLFLLGLLVLLVLGSSRVLAQEPLSQAVAKELTAALDQKKMDSIAAREGTGDSFVAALYFPGSQLLVVGAKYAVPQLLMERLGKREYRDIYIDLNSACVAGTRTLVMDLGADGMHPKRDEGERYDTYETEQKRIPFDGGWKAQKMSEEEYMKAFQDADARYSEMLKALLAQLKKTS